MLFELKHSFNGTLVFSATHFSKTSIYLFTRRLTRIKIKDSHTQTRQRDRKNYQKLEGTSSVVKALMRFNRPYALMVTIKIFIFSAEFLAHIRWVKW